MVVVTVRARCDDFESLVHTSPLWADFISAIVPLVGGIVGKTLSLIRTKWGRPSLIYTETRRIFIENITDYSTHTSSRTISYILNPLSQQTTSLINQDILPRSNTDRTAPTTLQKLIELCDHFVLQAKVTLYSSKKLKRQSTWTQLHHMEELRSTKRPRERMEKSHEDYKRSPINPIDSGFLARW